MINKTKLNRKGIEPIIAAVLLIAVAIVAGVLLYIWVTRLTTSGTAGTTVVGQVKVLSTYAEEVETDKFNVTVTIQAQAKPIVTKVLCYDTLGNYIDNVSSIGNVHEIQKGIYDVSFNVTITVPGNYYCEIVTSNLGTITTATFTITS